MKAITPFLNNKTHLIWDWNGTLLDDVELVVGVMNGLLTEHGLNQIQREDYVQVFGFPVVDYYRRLGFDFERVKFEKLSEKFIAGYKEALPNSNLHQGAKEFLERVKASGISQSVLSASHEGYLLEQLDHYGVRHCFDRVYGLNDYHAAGKVERGKALIAEAGIPPAETLLIGDTDHDLEVGLALGVEVLLLADGHQSFERLKTAHPHVLRCRYRGNLKSE